MQKFLAPTPASSDLPGRHWDPTKAPQMPHVSSNELKFLGAFIVICFVLWCVHRIATGHWGPGDGD